MTSRERLWHLIIFGFHWALIGFALGTITLIGPLRWMTRFTRRLQWSQGTENALAIGVMLLLVLISFLAAALLLRLMKRVSRSVAGVLALATLIAAAAALGMWMNPALVVAHMGTEVNASERFTFGPYPTDGRMILLKAEGYTTIVSLLHPAVVPFEPRLIADEQEAARRLGLTFIHVPMLPWISDNEAATARLAAIAKSSGGRYYIHCYLGQDRIKMARAILEQAAPDRARAVRKDAEILRRFATYERGTVYELERDVFLAPFPTDEEFVMIVGAAATVVSLLDPTDPNDQPWVERERSLLARYGTRLVEMPMSPTEGPARAKEIARAVRGLPRPIVVHSFLSPSTGRAPVSQTFRQEYLKGPGTRD